MKLQVIGKHLSIILFIFIVSCDTADIDNDADGNNMNDAIPAIDSHIHLALSSPFAKYSKEEALFYNLSIKEKAEKLQEEMTKAGIKMVFAMGQIGGASDDPLGINENLKVAALVPGVKVIGAADPMKGLNPKHIAATKAQIQKKRNEIVALKCYLGYLGGPEDPGYQPYYKLAEEFNLPVIFHTGDTWSAKGDLKLSHPLGVDRIAWKYPSLRIVLAHVGVPWHQDACEVAWKNDNVWLDIAGLLLGDDEFINDMLRERKLPDAVPGLVINDLINALTYMDRYDRVLYATDWPVISSSMVNYRHFIEALIPKEHHQNVFRDNAKELFGVSFGEHKE